jgi:hypothetical protein
MRNTSAFQPNGLKQIQLADTSLFSDANLVAYWKLEDTADSKGSYTLTNNNTTPFVAGKFNNGADLELGSSHSLTHTSSAIISGTGNFSISCWVKFESLKGATGDVAVSIGNIASNQQFSMGAVGGFFNGNWNGGAGGITAGKVAPTLGVWYHLVAVVNGASQTWQMYVNGSLYGTPVAAPAYNMSSGGSNGNIIGNYTVYDANWGFDGMIDDVAIFSRALSAGEISQLYYSGSTKAYYPLNGNSYDFSGNGNTGTDTAITYPQGRFGQAAKFNGSSSSISLGAGSSFNNATFTYSAWINLQTAPTDNPNIISGSGTNYPCFRVNSSYQLNLLRQGVADLVSSSRTIKLNRWHHVVVTDDSSGNYAFYIDGYTAGSGSHAAQTWARTSNYLGNPSGERWNGLIDEVIIESRAWTAKEVETYYRKSMLNYKQNIFGSILAYVLQVTKGTLTLTGKTVKFNQTFKVQKSSLSIVGKTVAFIFRSWRNVVKNVSTWTNSTKHSSTFTNKTKNSSTWTRRNKN